MKNSILACESAASVYDVKLGMYDGKKFSIIVANENVVRDISREKRKLVLTLLFSMTCLSILLSREDQTKMCLSMQVQKKRSQRVDQKEYKVAFILNPFSIKDVEKKAFEETRISRRNQLFSFPRLLKGS